MRTALIISMIVASLAFHAPQAAARQAQCTEIARRQPAPQLRLLTINLLFSEIEHLLTRLQTLATFISNQQIDVVLLQEVVDIDQPPEAEGQQSTAALLQTLLRAEHGKTYNRTYRMADSIPGVFTLGNAILSRCAIVSTTDQPLPSTPPSSLATLLERRDAMLSRLNIPGIGMIAVYNTHLGAGDDAAGLLAQVQALMQFVQAQTLSLATPVIVGGDFNLTLADPNLLAAYATLTDGDAMGLGLTDSYARLHPQDLCLGRIDQGCTDGVSFIKDPLAQGEQPPQRIDYLFVRGVDVIDSKVVFNSKFDSTQPSVSDHAGVFTTVGFSH